MVDVVIANIEGQSSTLTNGFTYRPSGDANGDGLVNAADIFYLISFLFTGGPAPVAGDPNGDNQVTPSDVFYLINFLFAGGPLPI